MEAEENHNYIPEHKYNDTDSLKFRLDPSNLIFEIEKKLNGGYNKTYLDENNELKTQFIKVGTKLLNDQGIQRVINRISSIVNSHTVLGYLKNHDSVSKIMMDWHRDLRKELFINRFKYDIKSASNLQHIINVCTDFVKLFLTRLIDRNEAKALEQTYSISELRNPNDNKGFLGFKR